jgi:hypothetical protein
MNGRRGRRNCKVASGGRWPLLRAPEFPETNKKQHAGLDSSCYARHLETASPSGRAKPPSLSMAPKPMN